VKEVFMKVIKYHQNSSEVKYLVEKDARLAKLFSQREEILVSINDDYFQSLVGVIVAQQLSSKVASVIYKRLLELLNNEVVPDKINCIDELKLKEIGLSYQKIKYLKSLADCVISKKVDFSSLNHLSDHDIIEMLTQIKGIGIWSAQMFLIFSLGREDVFSVLDLGLRNALKKIYDLPELSNKEIEEISMNWSPYRSIVSHFLWHAWDNPS
jgi:DNA-3-methyladenine glycosylase II